MKTRHSIWAASIAVVLWASAGCDDDGSLAVRCPTGSVVCGSACSNLQGDPDNCGACFNACAHGQLCDLGKCTGAGFDAGKAADAAPKPPTDASSSDGAGDVGQDVAQIEGGGPG